jgi:hypothetical protein
MKTHRPPLLLSRVISLSLALNWGVAPLLLQTAQAQSVKGKKASAAKSFEDFRDQVLTPELLGVTADAIELFEPTSAEEARLIEDISNSKETLSHMNRQADSSSLSGGILGVAGVLSFVTGTIHGKSSLKSLGVTSGVSGTLSLVYSSVRRQQVNDHFKAESDLGIQVSQILSDASPLLGIPQNQLQIAKRLVMQELQERVFLQNDENASRPLDLVSFLENQSIISTERAEAVRFIQRVLVATKKEEDANLDADSKPSEFVLKAQLTQARNYLGDLQLGIDAYLKSTQDDQTLGNKARIDRSNELVQKVTSLQRRVDNVLKLSR